MSIHRTDHPPIQFSHAEMINSTCSIHTDGWCCSKWCFWMGICNRSRLFLSQFPEKSWLCVGWSHFVFRVTTPELKREGTRSLVNSNEIARLFRRQGCHNCDKRAWSLCCKLLLKNLNVKKSVFSWCTVVNAWKWVVNVFVHPQPDPTDHL